MAIKNIIWDLDNTLYPFPDSFKDSFNGAAAKAAIDLGVKEPLEKLLEIGLRSFEEHGSSLVELVERYRLNRPELHMLTMQNLNVNTIQPMDASTVIALHDFKGRHAVLTHSTTDWAERVLQRLGIAELFDPDNVIGIEKVGYARKESDLKPFEHVLMTLQSNPENAAMIEDRHENLIIPKDMGMTTVYIDYSKNSAHGDEDYIDHVITDPSQLFPLIS